METAPCCPSCSGEWWDPDDPRPLVHLEVTELGLVVTCARCGHEAPALVLPAG